VINAWIHTDDVTSTELIGLAASIASLVLAVVAIGLSIVFFVLATKAAQQTGEAAKEISSGVERLEGLFNLFYRDTFTMMRDTFSDFRKHAWPGPPEPEETAEAEAKANEQFSALQADVSTKMQEMLHNQGIADKRIGELTQLVEGSMQESREIEARSRTDVLQSAIRAELRAAGGSETANRLVESLRARFSLDEILDEFAKMRRRNQVAWDGSPRLSPQYVVRLVPPSERIGRRSQTEARAVVNKRADSDKSRSAATGEKRPNKASS